MDTEVERLELKAPQKPQVFVNSITFNDGTARQLTHGSIVVFTGANNSGKSQVLRDIELRIKDARSPSVIVSELTTDYVGEFDDDFVVNKFKLDDDGNYWLGGNGTYPQGWKSQWNNHSLSILFTLFVNRLDTEERLIASKTKPLYNGSPQEQHNSLHTVYEFNAIEDTISKLFYEAFGEALIVNRRAGTNVALQVGKRPSWEGQRDGEGSYYDAVRALPLLDKQGDGMRSFASILLDTFTSDHSVTLIDEPEAFLHPPQARILGKMLAKNNPCERQLFIATHSADFINGLLDADNNNVIVIRINRDDNTNHMNTLGNDKIKELWSNPLLRYSNILNGLFHEKIVVCESDYDCLFYRAILDAIFESDGKTAPDIMFTHCGGKDRMKDVVAALNALKVPVVAIPDFDIVDDSAKLKSLSSAFGINWNNVSDNMNKVYACINAENGKIRSMIKKNGSSVFTGEAPAAFCAIDSFFRSAGLFIVPIGDIESFDKTVNKDKKDWVYAILERGNLNSESNLETARKFVKSIVDYKPSHSE
ncbi:ATP-dependent nuclease [Sedimentibacter saalensis]|uniref:Putative AbiEii toxin of type IV toxin-antitoxin system n=1 Tax=Sedimentibacter saalensis TaxID=130788 RepID=A0A562J3P5_9FIRM|nr:AAA family ATPase [Sedimentibacter saalensis]TWH77767.1 putative AbiEii toxin of type IV toxin-antitoxin system [Sedimentibacter saalensis]